MQYENKSFTPRAPAAVSEEEVASNWERTFGVKTKCYICGKMFNRKDQTHICNQCILDMVCP